MIVNIVCIKWLIVYIITTIISKIFYVMNYL